jgi:signal transduction histidine kinase
MRSLYGRIFVAFFTTLVVSLFSFATVFFAVTRPRMNRNVPGFAAVQADTAEWALSIGGRDGLRTYMGSLNASFPLRRHYLVDVQGVDVLSGDDRSALLSLGRIGRPSRTVDGKVLLIQPSADGRFKLIAELPAPGFNLTLVLPYFGLLFGAIAGVCWLIAAGIASPVRRLAAVVERFGAGDMTARIHLRRRDELGDLASAYNKMADRIGVLLAAERQLLQDISHELRTPLARLNVGIELSRSAEDRSLSADRLRLEAQRLTALVTSLIETTRAEGNLAAPEMEIFDMTTLLPELSDHFTADTEGRGIAIALELESDVPLTVRGNVELVRRALDNVLRNALQHAPDGSRIDIRCHQHDGHVLIAIRDWGEGVPEQVIERLGAPFFRVDESRSESTGGMGLGLAIAKRAMHLHRGTLVVENASPGLRIILRLPAATV